MCCDRLIHFKCVHESVRERALSCGLSLREHYKIIKRIKVSVRENLQPQYKFEIIHLTLCKELIHKKAVNLSSRAYMAHHLGVHMHTRRWSFADPRVVSRFQTHTHKSVCATRGLNINKEKHSSFIQLNGL